jgi:hypothetical protein
MEFSPEAVGYWYFRLNGFLTIPNFILHPDEAANQRSDADIIGIRFPHRAELFRDPMRDDEVFTAIQKPFIVFAEIKRGCCEINRTYRNREGQNVQRILRAVGIFHLNLIDEVAESIYATGAYTSNTYHISFCCLGDSRNPQIADRYPNVLQIIWDDALSFVYRRFDRYRSRKYDHPQWDETGKLLWNISAEFEDSGQFSQFIKRLWRANEGL